MIHGDHSSGNLVADRRSQYAQACAETRDFQAAIEISMQALELVPRWGAGWFRLGNFYERAGDQPKALASYKNALLFSSDDRLGAAIKIAFLEGTELHERPLSYTEALFDAYASDFDAALVERLDYKVPQQLAQLLRRHALGIMHPSALDLGCGTGLMGAEIRDKVSWLIGIDISEPMLVKAREKKIYDVLQKADIGHAFVEGEQHSLITAADVFMYIPNLAPLFVSIAGALEDNGYFLFSVEKASNSQPWQLLESMRHAHNAEYVQDLLGTTGLVILEKQETIARMDRGNPVPALIYLTQKQPAIYVHVS